MFDMKVSGDSSGYVWRLFRLTPYGADLLARGCRAYADEAACHESVGYLVEAAPEDLVVSREHGQWEWRVGDSVGVIAKSPPVFRDATSCADAFDELQSQLRVPRA